MSDEWLGKVDRVRIEKEGIPDETILNYHLKEMEYMAQLKLSEGVSERVSEGGREGGRQGGREGASEENGEVCC
jgi:hypothetical protein